MVRPSWALGQLSQWGAAVVLTVVTSSAPAKATPVGSVPTLVLANCRSIETRLPTQSELEALQALILKYHVSVSRLKPSGVTTRCQFAHALDLTIDRLSALIGSVPSTVSKEAVQTAGQLFALYHTEVTSQLGVHDLLEAQPTRLTSQSFSTTTKLGGEWLEPQPKTPPVTPLPAASAAPVVPVVPVDAVALANCRSTEARLPTPSELETLQALVQKYKVAVPDVAIDKAALTRCQFASHLRALIDQVNAVMAAGNFELVAKADLSTFQQLEEAYATELAYYRFVHAVETGTATLEKKPFSTLCSEDSCTIDPTVASLKALRAWLDDPTSKAMTMQFSTTTTLRRDSLLQLQSVPLRFQRDALSTSTKPPAPRTFAPTTTLHVETVLELSGTAGNH